MLVRSLLTLLARQLSPMPTVVAKIPTGSQPCAATSYGRYFYVDDYGSGRHRAHRPADEHRSWRRPSAAAPAAWSAAPVALGRELQRQHDRARRPGHA